MEALSYKDVKKQSQAVFNQFGQSKWIPFAKENARHPNRRDPNELRNIGAGRTLVSVAMGASLESRVDTIKKYRGKADIITCDKGFRELMARGIKPDYVMLCDCNILWPKWGPKEEDTEGVALIATPYANVTWTRRWRGPVYFYVNRDAIDSQDTFLEIMGPKTRTIPASSNVSNAQFVFMTGADEKSLGANFSGYEKFLLVGYDYCYRPDQNYYAWANPKPKRFYMNHETMLDTDGRLVFSSSNLIFSARWLRQYIQTYRLHAVNCNEGGLLEIPRGDLQKELESVDLAVGERLRLSAQSLAAARQSLAAAEVAHAAIKEAYHGSR